MVVPPTLHNVAAFVDLARARLSLGGVPLRLTMSGLWIPEFESVSLFRDEDLVFVDAKVQERGFPQVQDQLEQERDKAHVWPSGAGDVNLHRQPPQQAVLKSSAKSQSIDHVTSSGASSSRSSSSAKAGGADAKVCEKAPEEGSQGITNKSVGLSSAQKRRLRRKTLKQKRSQNTVVDDAQENATENGLQTDGGPPLKKSKVQPSHVDRKQHGNGHWKTQASAAKQVKTLPEAPSQPALPAESLTQCHGPVPEGEGPALSAPPERDELMTTLQVSAEEARPGALQLYSSEAVDEDVVRKHVQTVSNWIPMGTVSSVIRRLRRDEKLAQAAEAEETTNTNFIITHKPRRKKRGRRGRLSDEPFVETNLAGDSVGNCNASTFVADQSAGQKDEKGARDAMMWNDAVTGSKPNKHFVNFEDLGRSLCVGDEIIFKQYFLATDGPRLSLPMQAKVFSLSTDSGGQAEK